MLRWRPVSSVNLYAKEISLKIVYYGPGLGGKTSSLQYIHRAIKPDARGQLVSLSTGVDRTLYFDFLPVKLPKLRGYTVRVQLYTVPGQVHYNSTRKLVLTGADGIVFVADSQRARREASATFESYTPPSVIPGVKLHPGALHDPNSGLGFCALRGAPAATIRLNAASRY